MIWLKEHHPDYRNIEINEETLREYPENGGNLTGIRTINDTDQETENNYQHQAPNDDNELNQAVQDIEDEGDMPRPESFVPDTANKIQIGKRSILHYENKMK